MPSTRNDIKALAKLRYPLATTIDLKRLSDFQTLGVAAIDADQPDWLLIISGGEDAIEYKAESLDMLQVLLSSN